MDRTTQTLNRIRKESKRMTTRKLKAIFGRAFKGMLRECNSLKMRKESKTL